MKRYLLLFILSLVIFNSCKDDRVFDNPVVPGVETYYAMQNFTVSIVTETKAVFKWSDPNKYNQKFLFVYTYMIERKQKDSSYKLVKEMAIGRLSDTIDGEYTGLETFRIRTTADQNYGPDAYASGAIEFPAPSNLTVTFPDSTTARLTWQDNSSFETGFEIMMSTDSINYTPVKEVPANTVSADINGTYSQSIRYYYKLRAKTALNVSPYSNVSSSGLTPKIPVLTIPANNAADIILSPTLTWNTSAGAASYTLQVSTSSTFSSYVYNQSGLRTSQQISGLSNSTTYYWRVSASNSYGTSSYSAAQSFTTGALPGVPVLLSPANNSTYISLSPTLRWTAISGVISYTLQVSANNTFASFVYNQSGLTEISQQISGLSNMTTYYWRVSAANIYGMSSYSAVQSFTTGAAPDPPVLASPVNNAKDISIMPALTWNASTGAASYTLQVSTTAAFSSFVYNQSGLTSLNQQISGLNYLTTYYWRVSAGNSFGTSQYSNVYSFATIDFPAPSNLTVTFPDSTTARLTWQDNSSFETGFEIMMSTDSINYTPVKEVPANTVSADINGTYSQSIRYYYKLRAKTALNVSPYSNVSSSGLTPKIPVLTIPANNAADVILSPTLTWNTSAGAASYTLQVSASNTFSSYVYNQSGLTGISRQISGLSNSTIYYWRVSASNIYGTSSYSAAQSFTTGALPGVPVLLSPANNAVDMVVPPTLTWSASQGAISYTLQVSVNSTFGSIVYTDSGITGTIRQVPGLSSSMQYYWRVSVTTVYGTSPWSGGWNFTTGAAPAAPVLTSPANGSIDIALSNALTWNASQGAASYTLQVSSSITFASFAYNQSGLTSLSQQIPGLSNFTTYYWRVSAANNFGTSAYSSVWSFATIGTAPSAPDLSIPANNTANIVLSPTLSWNASIVASSYTLQVSSNNSFSDYVYNKSGITGISQGISGLNNLTTYYWRVNATNSYGTSASWSSVWSFTTGVLPAAPVLTAPLNNAVDVSISPVLTWNSVTAAAKYHLQVSNSSTFVAMVVDDNTITGTTRQLTGLTINTVYYWRVNVTNGYGTSSYSAVSRFTTIVPPPDGMALVIAGTFTMGSTNSLDNGASPTHSVTLSSFYMGKTEVTQGQWKAVMGSNPSYFPGVGDNGPVEQVTWYACISYCNKLSIKEGKTPVYSINGNTSPSDWTSGVIVFDTTAKGYRLPTEAEWEYAAKGGNQSHNYTYSGSNTIGDVAWYYTNSYNSTHQVSTKTPNELGISDMSGNVMEWCWDWFGEYINTAQTNPNGPSIGTERVLRGGPWSFTDNNCCRVSYRYKANVLISNYGIGFRVVLDL